LGYGLIYKRLDSGGMRALESKKAGMEILVAKQRAWAEEHSIEKGSTSAKEPSLHRVGTPGQGLIQARGSNTDPQGCALLRGHAGSDWQADLSLGL